MKKINSLKITDTTFRDAQQSILATRLCTSDMEILAEDLDKAGFYSLEVWGGATFDVALRFLNEDPWERLRILKRLIRKTPLQMLLRGQNLVGYRQYADDVIKAFIHYAAECGVDIFRVFDALNDERNLESSLKAIKECAKHAQLAICYSLTQEKLGGPIYNLNYFLKKAILLQEMGADSLCIKDMAGLLSPDDAFKLVRALKKVLRIPLQLHSHCTSGMAPMTYLKAIEAGVDGIDTSLAPFALRSSQPAIEPILIILKNTSRDPRLNLNHLIKVGEALESIAQKYRDFLDTTKMSIIDTGVLIHQIPGGMTSNLVLQLREVGAVDKLAAVLKEIPQVRKELGYPPLVTPTSQIVGVQAVQNVLLGRYKVMSLQVRDYIFGLYGRPPAPIDPKIQKLASKGYAGGLLGPITCRPADRLSPELGRAREAIADISEEIGDILIQALYDKGVGRRFLEKHRQKEDKKTADK